LHPTVVFTPQRVNLGVVGLRMWQRPEEPVAHERVRKPIAEKESYLCYDRCLGRRSG